MVQTWDLEDKLHLLFHGHQASDYATFWNRFRASQGDHPVYDDHDQHLGRCCPIMLHTDEGVGQKKKALLILQVQAVLGSGSSRSTGMNFLGSTFLTRILYTVMPAKTYSTKPSIYYSLLENLSSDLLAAYRDGIMLERLGCVIYLVPIGCKGDWPALIKTGKLNRSFQRLSPKETLTAPGICHLCRAGMHNVPWHEYSTSATWLTDMKENGVPLPWSRRAMSPLLKLPMSPSCPQSFFLVDCFHTLHKGCFADLAASASDAWLGRVYAVATSLLLCPLHVLKGCSKWCSA